MNATFIRGRLYYNPSTVRIWIGTGFFDLGCRSLESCQIVADEFDLELIVNGIDCEPKPARAASEIRNSEGDLARSRPGSSPGVVASAGDSERSSLKALVDVPK